MPRRSTGPVVGRALQLLEAFSARSPTLTLSQLARHSGLPVSTAHRMVGELVTWGALERGGDGAYRVGLRLWEVGSLAPRGQGLRERALPFLEATEPIRFPAYGKVVRPRALAPHPDRHRTPATDEVQHERDPPQPVVRRGLRPRDRPGAVRPHDLQ